MANRSISQAKGQAEQAGKEAAPWAEKLARLGYIAKGVVYTLIGVLAFQVAIGTGGETTGSQGVLQNIAAQPFGRVLLVVVGLGLFGYALWRFVQAGMDPEHKGSDGEGIVKRLGYAVSGGLYLLLSFSAVRIVMGSGGGGGGSSEQEMTARVLSQPFGQWLVGIGGAIVIGAGLYQMYKGFKAKFREQLKLGEMSDTEETWATRAGRIGLMARGFVFGLIGLFLIRAAYQADPDETKGVGQALSELAQQPFGPWLLGIVALGLVAYGIFMIVQARYRRIPA